MGQPHPASHRACRHPAGELDAALQTLNRTPGVSLIPEENQKVLTAADRDAAHLGDTPPLLNQNRSQPQPDARRPPDNACRWGYRSGDCSLTYRPRKRATRAPDRKTALIAAWWRNARYAACTSIVLDPTDLAIGGVARARDGAEVRRRRGPITREHEEDESAGDRWFQPLDFEV